jgi:polyisoprenoid-binding protein YceI
MIARTIATVAAVGIVVGLSFGFAPQQRGEQVAASNAADSAFAVDSVHSSVVFKISHMDVASFWGRFNHVDGSYSVDAANPTASAFQFTVNADSIDSNSDGRDKHLKSADFFNVAEYPTITFKSSKVANKQSENHLAVTGDLTLHGVTKPVEVDMKLYPAKETRQGLKGGFDAQFTIKRSDFGMNYGVSQGALGDEVTIFVSIEGAKRKAQE